MIIGSLLIIFATLLFAISFSIKRRTRKGLVGFLHPASGGGGGGERVLWVAIQHLLQTDSSRQVALYSTEFPAPNAPSRSYLSSNEHLVATLIPTQFGIQLTPDQRSRLHIHYIPFQHLQDPNLYPFARLLLQSLVGGLALALGVLYNIVFDHRGSSSSDVPDLFIDSVGIPFSYIWLRLATILSLSSTRIGCYVHYPYISTDMIDSVSAERVMPNNPQPATGWKKALKLKYYRAMVLLYRWCAGFCVNGPIACNSTWTRNHIRKVWGPAQAGNGGSEAIKLLFPPVNVDRFKKFDLEARFHRSDEILVVSVGQFRPEKNHPLLLRSFARALKQLASTGVDSSACDLIKLKVIGGARNDEDKQRAAGLSHFCTSSQEIRDALSGGCVSVEQFAKQVEFCVNAPFDELEQSFANACVGLHTMRDEHFGIVVVEYMASGCVAIAHNSAGPAEIVRDKVDGFLCRTEEEYADALVHVLTKVIAVRNSSSAANQQESAEYLNKIQAAARTASGQYGDGGFGEAFEKIFLS